MAYQCKSCVYCQASVSLLSRKIKENNAIRKIRDDSFDGVVEIVTESELMDSKAQIDRLGISICPNSAVAVSGAMKLRENQIIHETDDVVVILTAHGSKFSNTGVEYHTDSSNTYANTTITIDASLQSLENALKL